MIKIIPKRAPIGWLRMRRLMLALLVIGLLAACVAPATQPAANDATASNNDTSTGVPTYANWDEVLAAAKGTSVTWALWGGSDTINQKVDEQVGQPLLAQFGITLNRVPLENTADAVNKVLAEKAAGKVVAGSTDAIWINGTNFRTMKEGNLLYGPYTNLLPNANLVNWDDPALAYDFGVAIEGYESPWASFQWVLEYNSANVTQPPKNFDELREWVKTNPGRFTYPAPPNYVGSAFVRQLFYWQAGKVDPFLVEFDQATFDAVAPKVWAYLNEIEPFLWREGQTYPEQTAMPDLLANGELDFNMEYDASRASNYIIKGQYPDTIRTAVFDAGTPANVSYIAIPFNASNPAGALVLANFLLSPDYQISLTKLDGLGWMVAIDPTKLAAEAQSELASVDRGPAGLSAAELNSHALPEARASWVQPIDDGWVENVLKK